MAIHYLDEIEKTATKPWNIMEMCGGQTHSLVKNGLLGLLPKNVRMIHGPGCPVCVTPISLIDKAVSLMEKGIIMCSFGDMVRVPGSTKSLLDAKAEGGDLRILYSPLEAVKIAEQNPDKEVVFFAVGFETTAPSNALSVVHAQKLGLKNFSLLVSHVLAIPAMESILDDELCNIQAFLGPGHVCTIMGLIDYRPLAEQYQIPIVIAGFEPVDLLRAIYHTVSQLEKGEYKVENCYERLVKEEGNTRAKEVVNHIFEIGDQEWRGMGIIPNSGMVMKEQFWMFDASRKFDIETSQPKLQSNCIVGEILRGLKKPFECPEFAKGCNPTHPHGAPMVSSEGACAAYYHYSR
ncbi:hydrogenase formation protein HypD [Epilithonimonas ginsengisoli]|uniref:Hydrogenase formation protein HypD n=1 Tax=Epilithonimonas ginsengisoli TaxID=1245592 RepID=A0ABU4JL62_9FLAO|nr:MULTISPECIES: hydrogenase formation protein HypD [Chryseobacterium group]MBV6881498.1 hydrogenase formation protein HypD [Epilithonimonas sp. FP105]MDW8550446.1 hydrogenase formation protein HypD [Epilithonimonas ginsengisoli]OAH72705.1 hydrogenase formation protein HypD [Chryseobacterium sp. FP211-J200]